MPCPFAMFSTISLSDFIKLFIYHTKSQIKNFFVEVCEYPGFNCKNHSKNPVNICSPAIVIEEKKEEPTTFTQTLSPGISSNTIELDEDLNEFLGPSLPTLKPWLAPFFTK